MILLSIHCDESSKASYDYVFFINLKNFRRFYHVIINSAKISSRNIIKEWREYLVYGLIL